MNLKDLAIFSGRTRFTSKRVSQSPVRISQSMEFNAPYNSLQQEAQPLSATPSYYSDAPLSSSSTIGHWASEPRRNEYVEPPREQYLLTPERHMSHPCHIIERRNQLLSQPPSAIRGNKGILSLRNFILSAATISSTQVFRADISNYRLRPNWQTWD